MIASASRTRSDAVLHSSFASQGLWFSLLFLLGFWAAGCSTATPIAPMEDSGVPGAPDGGHEAGDAGGVGPTGPDAGAGDAGLPAAPGSEGGRCYGNGTCDGDLECSETDICMRTPSAQGEAGGPCYGNGTCNAGLLCEADVCTAPAAGPGSAGGPCYGNGTCDEGLLCIEAVCAADPSIPTAPPVIRELDASPSTIDHGMAAVLSWLVEGATGCVLSPDVGEVPTTGSESVTPSEDTLYTLTCTNDVGSVSQDVLVRVNPPVRIVSFTANGEPDALTIDAGQSVTLAWTTENALSCAITPDPGAVQRVGSTEVRPAQSRTYTLTCQGVGGPASREVAVTVNPGVAVTFFLANDQTGPLRVDAGADVAFRWSVANALSCELDLGAGPLAVPAVGQRTESFSSDQTVRLTCQGVGGPVSATIVIGVNPPVRILSFAATPALIDFGQFTVLSWTTEHASACRIEASVASEAVGTVATNGTVQVTPERSLDYKLICEGIGGPVERSVSVSVRPPVVIEDFTAAQYSGDFLSSLSLDWTVSNATSCALNDGIGQVGSEGPRTVTLTGLPGTTQVFTLTCEGIAGPVSESVSIAVNNRAYIGDVTICGPNAASSCAPGGLTLSQLVTYNTIQGDVTVDGTTSTSFVWPKLVTVTGQLAIVSNVNATRYEFSSLRSVGGDLSTSCNPADDGPCSADRLNFPSLESVGGSFRTVGMSSPLWSAPKLVSVGNHLRRSQGDALCTELDFSSLEEVGGDLYFFASRSANVHEAFPVLERIGGKLYFSVEYAATQSELNAAFAGVTVGGTTTLEGAATNGCN